MRTRPSMISYINCLSCLQYPFINMLASYLILCFRCIGVSFVFDLYLILKHHSEEYNAKFILASLPSLLLENKFILFRITFFPDCRCRRLLLHLITINHTHTQIHSLELLWPRDRTVAETSTWQYTTNVRDKHPQTLRDSKQPFQEAMGRRPTRFTAVTRTGLYIPYILNVLFYKNNLSLCTSLLLPEIRLLKVLAWHGKSVTVWGILMTYAL
jgi:hypothetical protein